MIDALGRRNLASLELEQDQAVPLHHVVLQDKDSKGQVGGCHVLIEGSSRQQRLPKELGLLHNQGHEVTNDPGQGPHSSIQGKISSVNR